MLLEGARRHARREPLREEVAFLVDRDVHRAHLFGQKLVRRIGPLDLLLLADDPAFGGVAVLAVMLAVVDRQARDLREGGSGRRRITSATIGSTGRAAWTSTYCDSTSGGSASTSS